MSVKFDCGFRRIGSVDEVSAVFAEVLMTGRFDEFFATVGISKDEILSVVVILEEYAWMVLGEDLNAEDFFPGEDSAQILQSLGLENGSRILLGAGTVPIENVPGEITAYLNNAPPFTGGACCYLTEGIMLFLRGFWCAFGFV